MPGNNKIVAGGEVLINLTSDTVTENTLLSGATAHNAAGESIQGAVALPIPDSRTLISADGIWSVNIAPNAGAHNAIYRGKYLGNAVTAGQYAAIAAGTFDDLYIGDYWTIGGMNYRIAAFDYYLNCGKTEVTTDHHVLLVPDGIFRPEARMNVDNVTTGNYVHSRMYGSDYSHTGGGLAQTAAAIRAAFSGHILIHEIILPSAVAGGKNSGLIYTCSEVDLMTERMVYGCPVFSGSLPDGSEGIDNTPTNYTQEKSQLPLFAHEPSRIAIGQSYWLRDVVSAFRFAFVDFAGSANSSVASTSYGLRPYFCIYGGAAA